MNDSELEKLLKAAPGPGLTEEYRQAFTEKVLGNLRSSPVRSTPPRSWRPRFAWALATAGCVLLAFWIGRWHGRAETGQDILTNSKVIHETLAMFPHRVRAIVSDQHGINLVLSDADNVPASPPIYVRISDGKNLSSMVTFSGQEIQIDGQKLTVLAEEDGGIILEGKGVLWSNGKAILAAKNMQIQARTIAAGVM